MKQGIFITFDVECSMGGAWSDPSLKPIPPKLGMMGEYGDRAFGVPLICDILGRNNLKATFFLEPFNDELGYPGETEPVCRFIVDRGHDVQLHVHPGHVNYGLHVAGKPYIRTDQIADLPPERQRAMVVDGAERIEQWTGVRPIAFRAGNMGASEQTLKILPDTGIWIDSSYTFPYAGGQCRFPKGVPYNGSKWYGDVLEVALSGFQQTKLPGLHPSKPVDLMGSSFEECRDAVRMICDAARRFERFCGWLRSNRATYPTRTFAELGRMIREDGYEPKAVDPCMIRRPLRAVVRNAVQVLNRFYWF
jgi:hypothetical protein